MSTPKKSVKKSTPAKNPVAPSKKVQSGIPNGSKEGIKHNPTPSAQQQLPKVEPQFPPSASTGESTPHYNAAEDHTNVLPVFTQLNRIKCALEAAAALEEKLGKKLQPVTRPYGTPGFAYRTSNELSPIGSILDGYADAIESRNFRTALLIKALAL